MVPHRNQSITLNLLEGEDCCREENFLSLFPLCSFFSWLPAFPNAFFSPVTGFLSLFLSWREILPFGLLVALSFLSSLVVSPSFLIYHSPSLLTITSLWRPILPTALLHTFLELIPKPRDHSHLTSLCCVQFPFSLSNNRSRRRRLLQ